MLESAVFMENHGPLGWS